MQASFSGPQKQRVDLWRVIKNEMATSCPGFDKDSEACRKKWRIVYKEYRDEKMLQAASDASQRCRFYDLLEYFTGDRADGASEPPAGYDLPVKDEVISVKSEAFDGNEGANGQEAYAVKKSRKRVKRFDLVKASTVEAESLQPMVSELVVLGKEMLQTTRQLEQDKLEVLHLLRETLREISGKL
ncbi:hypothetical protein L7F22_030886 [Adiantum nelumboides]|nr:hypothetical protein [Adiantum nelumboides]